ncbi:biofilm regulation diguanylate cyclase SiaD [Parachitinimonas caeni]|uniref:diguanylate cyclase n=1 Tax=Parachitinimonas caeni TaxID=3031301 RepID=A0ABT7E181_9NEIS|nr:biofilm regulation diguanylate cyclase SiaD [Parachitinimonas caeni]MDK2126073.1 biofilm regulation diguanylate cyclase SiaD [Parachitinimonas caeni]
MREEMGLEQRVEALLEDPAYTGHPLKQILAELFTEYREQLRQMERITRISDHYQSMARDSNLSLAERYQKQMRQLEKIARISDGYQHMLHDLNQALRQASTHDPLTGLANRRLILDSLHAEIGRCERNGAHLSVVMVDVDHFKLVNDRYGHEAGDLVLVEVARYLQRDLREYDLCGRWGGEEFLLLLPETHATEAMSVVERMRLGMRQLVIMVGDVDVTVSASFGVAEHRLGASVNDTIKRADAAMLAAKRAGRDRSELAQ